MATGARPYKVWSCDRQTKKSVTASTLEEFMTKAKDKLKIADTGPVKVVFEADGTEVDEDDYFQFLPFNTTLMLLRNGEEWHSPDDMQGKDEPDCIMGDNPVPERAKLLASGLKREITRLITFSNDDLQAMVDMSTPSLAQLLGDTETYAAAVKEACQRHLDERQQTTEAMQLLKLYHRAREESPYIGERDDEPKRQKLAHT